MLTSDIKDGVYYLVLLFSAGEMSTELTCPLSGSESQSLATVLKKEVEVAVVGEFVVSKKLVCSYQLTTQNFIPPACAKVVDQLASIKVLVWLCDICESWMRAGRGV